MGKRREPTVIFTLLFRNLDQNLSASQQMAVQHDKIILLLHSRSRYRRQVSPWCDCDRWCDWLRWGCPRCACAKCEMCECANESASRPAFPLPPLCVEEDEEEVEPRWAGPSCEGRPIQCSMPDMSSPGPASSSEPDDESEHSGDRPRESEASVIC